MTVRNDSTVSVDSTLRNAVAMAAFRAFALVALGLVICASLFAAIGFALLAFHALLSPSLGATGAALATAGMALAIPLVVAGAAVLAARPRRTTSTAASTDHSPVTGSAEVNAALNWIADNPRMATLGALSTGMALGACPEIRRAVFEGAASTLRRQTPT